MLSVSSRMSRWGLAPALCNAVAIWVTAIAIPAEPLAATALPADGLLIYTGQPWHPQLEMIARALTSHRQGEAWVMRRRTQAELDQLVEDAGFRKIAQRIDEWGIFTVSLAMRRDA